MTPAIRARIEETIEQLVALLDAVDGDADFEPDSDGVPVLPAADGGDDRELEDEHDEDGGDDEVSDPEADGFGLAYRGDGAAIARDMLRARWRRHGGKTVGR